MVKPFSIIKPVNVCLSIINTIHANAKRPILKMLGNVGRRNDIRSWRLAMSNKKPRSARFHIAGIALPDIWGAQVDYALLNIIR